MRSEFRSELDVRVGKLAEHFTLLQPLVYYSERLAREIVAPAGFQTNFASIPRPLHWLIPVNGHHRAAAVVHDFLCVDDQHGLPQSESDAVFLEAMGVSGTPWYQRWPMYAGVRVFQSAKGIFV